MASHNKNINKNMLHLHYSVNKWYLILGVKLLTICCCFWDNHLGSKAIKIQEMSNTTDEHSVSEKLDLVKEVKPTYQGTQ